MLLTDNDSEDNNDKMNNVQMRMKHLVLKHIKTSEKISFRLCID